MCAVGTVPITRRRKVLDVPPLNESSDARQVPHYEFAKVHHTLLRSNGGSRLYGGSALLSIWEPVVTRPSDLSASSMIVSITPGVFLEAGWIVYPKRYGDSRPRLFIYWTIDNNLNRCWDMDCDGFVQVNNTVALGSPLEEVSTISGVKHVFRLTIHQDGLTKNWWLRLGGSQIGYWPASLFPSDIADGAEGLEWGGEVFDSIGKGQHTETDMGNGLFPNSDNASYVCALRYVDESLMLQIPDMSMLRVLVTNPKCYNARIIPITDEARGPCFLYGGSGLNPECP